VQAVGTRLSHEGIPASSGVRPPFRLLHGWQSDQVFPGAFAGAGTGITWSSVNSEEGIVRRQYWQVKRSRMRMFFRESALV